MSSSGDPITAISVPIGTVAPSSAISFRIVPLE